MNIEELFHKLHANFLTAPSLADIRNEDFTHIGRVHDWRNYIPPILKQMWPSLSDETIISSWYFAEEKASNEEWD